MFWMVGRQIDLPAVVAVTVTVAVDAKRLKKSIGHRFGSQAKPGKVVI
jgi:hypothetical protein